MTLRPASAFLSPSSELAALSAQEDLWWEKNKQWAVDKQSGRPLFYNDRFIIGDTSEEVRNKCTAIGIDLETIAIQSAPEVVSD